MCLDDAGELVVYHGERLGPGRRPELAVAAHLGRPQPVRIGVELTERSALRADVATAEHIRAVAPNPRDSVVAVELEFEPAGRLAQWAGQVCGSRHGPG